MAFGWKRLNVESTSTGGGCLPSDNAAAGSENGDGPWSPFRSLELEKLRIIQGTVSAVESLPFNPKLNSLELISLLFFLTTAGPFGIESAIHAAGPKSALIVLSLATVFWSIPLSLMTAELTSMMPETGGHVLWVHRAFGPFWAFMNNTCTIAYSVLDHAIYPTFFVECLSILFYGFDQSMPKALKIVIKLAIVLMITVPNFYGIRVVGFFAIILEVLVLIPLVAAALFAIPHLNFDWTKFDEPEKVEWGLLLTIILWKTSGFDAASACGREVENPECTYPLALGISTLSMALVSFTPILVGLSFLRSYTQWMDGSLLYVAKRIGGPILKVFVALSGALSALGLLLSRLSTNARLLSGMAHNHQMPSFFKSSLPEKRTPWMAMICTCSYTILLFWISFANLMQAAMWFYTLSTCLKFGSLIQLRYSEPEAYRPFRIPLSDNVLTCLMLIPIGICVLFIMVSSPYTHLVGVMGMLIGIVSYMATEALNQGYSTFFPFVWSTYKGHLHSIATSMSSKWLHMRWHAIFNWKHHIRIDAETSGEPEMGPDIALVPMHPKSDAAPR